MGCCGAGGTDAGGGADGKKFAVMSAKWDVSPDAIGEGGFGSVHLCKNRSNGKTRAIKAMRLSSDMDKEDFLNEVKIMEKIKRHRNICHILDSGIDRRFGYLVMQSCSGGELFDRIANKNMTEQDAAIAVQDIIAALRYIHGKRIVHRDLKPENVLYKDKEPGSPLKLIDFGLAVQLAPKHFESEICGTTSYMAPEVLNGHYQTECDMWSLGVMVFFMLSGKLPFTGRNDAEKEAKILSGQMSFSAPSWDKISSDGKDFVKALLVADPQKRMTGKKALNHPWITKSAFRGETTINEDVIKTLKQHAQQTRFQRAMRHKMATLLTTQELHQLRNMFESLDADGTGTVSIEEMNHALKDATALDDAASKALASLNLSNFDLDGDGEIDWREFVGGCVQDHHIYNEDNIERLFNEIDTDRSGTLSLKEITSLFGDDHELMRELGAALEKARLNDNDPTNDGKDLSEMYMTKQEFKAVLQDRPEMDIRAATRGRRNAPGQKQQV
ncbi:hypothetical protein AB1Y20_019248 [Prymnesium parvum]|uniref:Calmodulin n=1 Tax=Prymnesium parvum TaxID=97485 RepID=A0AB34JUG6_PRYPA|mmetsp:Transcript_23825/g.59145  ORF Transcript_23825/g.59145 Transcript_23825/m.59145 type:complete len:500 (-) Transcript_23825:261-1760(-)